MRVFITLDYELFFGPNSGSVQKCIIEPTEALLKLVDPYGIKLNLFVDVGYLLALERQMDDYPALAEDYKLVTDQIKSLAKAGHGVELHIHPHWEDSVFDGSRWVFDYSRYKLNSFSHDEVQQLVKRYDEALERISGTKSTAYRAGGWSAQPFKSIGEALRAQDIFIDSTAFPGGYYQSDEQSYNFRTVKQYNTKYRFSEVLTQADPQGEMLEIPISSVPVSGFFFWKFALRKIFKNPKHKAFGDGSAVKKSKVQMLRMMLLPSYSVVSIDGFKTSYLQKAFDRYNRNCQATDNFVIIGHPKAFTPYSLQKLKEFLSKNAEGHQWRTYADFKVSE